MSKKDKLKTRLLTKPKDFTWDELVSVLSTEGFELFSSSGPRRKFKHSNTERILSLHKPHPSKIIKRYVIDQAIEFLEEVNCEDD